MNRLRFATLLVVVFFAASTGFSGDGAKALFNGKTFDGWTQCGGKANYSVAGGAIVGRSVPNTSNSFLCTKKRFDDFVLEYEFKCDDQLNSGVQVRSNVYAIDTDFDMGNGKTKTIQAGRVHGYQVEIDPNKPNRMWTGGIYDEGRRGWLFPGKRGGDGSSFTEQGQRVFKTDDWNAVRVECRGDRIRTWLNGEPRADFEDDVTRKGFIALQVHGVGDRQEPLTVSWRNLVIRELED